MNKQEREIKKNTSDSTNYLNILYLFFNYKQSKTVRNKYNLNTHAITVLVSCYLYAITVHSLFTINAIKLFNGVYDFKRVKKYLGILVNVGLIAQRGVNKYSLTDSGIEAINEISHNSESLIYEFCNKYNLEL